MNPQPSWGFSFNQKGAAQKNGAFHVARLQGGSRHGLGTWLPPLPFPNRFSRRRGSGTGGAGGASCCVFFAFSVRPKTQQPRQDSCRGCGIYLGVDLLSHANIRSIMGDEALNFRVRNGFGCTRLSLDTKEISKYIIDRDEEVPFENKTHGLLVSVSSTPHSAYTSDLSTRSSTWALQDLRLGVLISRQASRLDAFSGYPFHT